MSHMLGSSTINSPLFMSDPVPVRRSGNMNSVQETNQAFLVKGDDATDSSVGTYTHVGGDEDVFIVNGETPGSSYKLHRQSLKDTLAELKPHANVSVRHLSNELTESFRSVVDALRVLHGSSALYDIVLNDIKTIFSDVKDVKPGTVSAFFIGCFNDDKFPGPMGCSPKCAASLPPAEGTPGYSSCDDIVLIYAEGLFSSLNEKRSQHAYIYIGDKDFVGFSSDNIKQLKEAGIENSSLIFGNQDGSYREVTSSLNIDQLPRKEEPESPQVSQQQNNNNTGAGIALAVIIILIVVLLFAIMYRNYSH